MKDKNRQDIEVMREWDRATQVRIIINRGKSDERDILLDHAQAKALVSDIMEAL